jgi:hypothetical protein
MARNVIDISESNFQQEVLGARAPALVHFWAGRSDPCEPWRQCLNQSPCGEPLPPAPQSARWHVAADTSGNTPQDWFADGEEPHLDNSKTYHVEARSSAILLARKQESATGGRSV